jgi:hypothetical protein
MSIYKKLFKIQFGLQAPKSQRNDFGKYNYRSCEDILQAVKPLLDGCTLVITDDIVFSGMLEDEIVSKGVMVKTQRVYIKSTATLSDGADSVSATAYAREASVKKGQDSSQVSGSTGSYSRKYALNGLFSIDDNKDSDATNKHDGVIDVDIGLDMSLEGCVGKLATEPKKRVNKAQMQKSIQGIVDGYEASDNRAMAECFNELDPHEVDNIWNRLNSKQQEAVRNACDEINEGVAV